MDKNTLISTSLPTVPGYYWHRKNAGEQWIFVDVRDLGIHEPYLNAYAVNEKWGGRSIRRWIDDGFPVGQWVAIERPPL